MVNPQQKEECQEIVALSPFNSAENPYLWLTKNALENLGYDVVPFDIGELLRSENVPNYVVLNWYEEIKGGMVRGAITFAKRYLKLFIARTKKAKVILVIHNKVPHDGATNATAALSRQFRLMLCNQANAIVGLCSKTLDVLSQAYPEMNKSNLQRKFHVVPHPSYEEYFKTIASDASISRLPGVVIKSQFVFLFVGQIRPYKNVELVLDVARRFEKLDYDAVFIIAGKCHDQSYLEDINRKASSNVVLMEGFIPDNEICTLIKASDALILPYNTKSSLNSGTCMLAFTLDRTVICPKIGTLESIPAELVYCYDYDGSESHGQSLFDSATKAYFDKQNNPGRFAERGKSLGSKVRNDNSLSATAIAWQAVLEAIGTNNEVK